MREVRTVKKRRVTALIIVAALLAAWWFGTYRLQVTTDTVTDGKIKNEITVVHLSDLHGASFGRDNERLISAVDSAAPDLIFVTGDMYTSGSESGREVTVRLMTDLAERYAVYFVNGEHDNSDEYFARLDAAGVHVMDYKSETVTLGSTEICIYGIDNVYFSATFDLHNEFEPDESKYNILLAHLVNAGAYADGGFDMTFCGDTHGGVVRLPVVGALYNDGVWLPEVLGSDNDRYTRGLYEVGGMMLNVSGGLGNYPIPLRFMNRPQMSVIKLMPAQKG